MLGAVFNLPEILENKLNKYKIPVDVSSRHGLTPLLVAIRHGSPDSVKYFLDLEADPARISVAHKHRIESGNMGKPIADEDMVENVLLNHEKSREHFLRQLERHLRTDAHPDPSRALDILYRASNEVPISAKVFEYRIKTRGLGELAKVLVLMDEDTFDEDMVAEVIRHDSCETVKRLYEFKHINWITEQMVMNALRSFDSNTVAYLVKQFGHHILTRQRVIDAKPRSHQFRKVILDVKGIQFINQEVFDSLFDNCVDPEVLTFVLDSCGTDMIRSSHIEILVDRRWNFLDELEPIFCMIRSLDVLITEKAVFTALEKENIDVATFLLENAKDPPSLLTKRVKDIANTYGGDVWMLILEISVNNMCD
ncbi:uncharacterized protein EAE97_002347 [Botrytis byssoidea]|uniref:Uncharacterized protein n=1 Tax=Botrytis byssoidea TaxID=139641 RepID=A0A9P5M8N8_9HELO|nr:uncharacterized protein EAE97_002347 [Botrytis byssoidea]KAF7950795.1 hypothetical protein EAE97_002347 [Botrytis byssoidea]